MPAIGPGRPVAVAFSGTEDDWAALELPARIAAAHGAHVQLLRVGDAAEEADAGRIAAEAAAAVEQLSGVATEPVAVFPGRLAEVAREAGLGVVGISGRWRAEGLGPIHSEVVTAVPAPLLFVRRGARPGLLRWRTGSAASTQDAETVRPASIVIGGQR